MLTYDPAIFDPDRRPEALQEMAESMGLDEILAPEVLAGMIAGITAVLDDVSPTKPETTSEQAKVVVDYLSSLALSIGMTRISIGDLEGGQATIANIATADAADLASAVTLANANKAKTNAILAALREAGVLAT